MKTFVFTCGDINGIGPEIVIKTLNRITRKSKDKFLFVCPENIVLKQFKNSELNFDYEIVSSSDYSRDVQVSVISFGNYKKSYGIPTKLSGAASLKSLEIAFNILSKSNKNAIITSPISKTAWVQAKISFPGHTELFAEWSKVKNYAMMFLSKNMKAALLTIHQPLKKVPALINNELLNNKFELFLKTLKIDFNIKSPKIAVLGLNPHAGENGLIGTEEKKILVPFLKKYSARKYFYGPYSSDGFFGMKKHQNYDLVVGMYHDQILNPFKLLNFNGGVNFTAGLPFVRTSPDHGTAFDIAGKGIADESSMVEAYKYAELVLNNRISNA